MIPEATPIISGLVVRHDADQGGLLYRVEAVIPDTDGYEQLHALNGLRRVYYTQLEKGSYPIGSPWDKTETEFRAYFTIENEPPFTSVSIQDFARNWGRGAPYSWHNMYKFALANPDFPLQPLEGDEYALAGNATQAITWLEKYFRNKRQPLPSFHTILERVVSGEAEESEKAK